MRYPHVAVRTRHVVALLTATASLTSACGALSGTPSDSNDILETYSTTHLSPLVDVVNATAGFVDVRQYDETTAHLLGPHFTVVLTATASAAQLDGDDVLGSGPPRLPGEGDEIFVVVFDFGADPALGWTGAWDGVTVEIMAGDTAIPMDDPQTALSGAWALALPAGTAPVLVVTDSGHSQSLDLTTGTRADDAIDGYYPIRTAATTLQQTTKVNGAEVGMVAEAAFELQPFEDDGGWAEADRSWLRITLGATLFTTVTACTLNPSASFSLVRSGETIEIPASTMALSVLGEYAPLVFAVDVPDGQQSISVTFQATGSCQVGGDTIAVRGYTGFGSSAESSSVVTIES